MPFATFSFLRGREVFPGITGHYVHLDHLTGRHDLHVGRQRATGSPLDCLRHADQQDRVARMFASPCQGPTDNL